MYSSDGETPVGQIRKQWSGIVKEMFTDADNFGITFPMDLDVNIKATLLGAVFLIVSHTSYPPTHVKCLINLLLSALAVNRCNKHIHWLAKKN